MWPFRRKRKPHIDPQIAAWLVNFQNDPYHAPNQMLFTREGTYVRRREP